MPLKDGPTATAELRAMGYAGAIFGVTGNVENRIFSIFNLIKF